MSKKISRGVTNEFDPYKLPYGTVSALSAFMLVIALLSWEWSAFFAGLVVIACMWATLGYIAFRDRDRGE